MRRKLVAFALSLGFLAAAYFGGAVGTVLSPVGFGGESRPADRAPFPASPVQECCGQLPVKGQDRHTEPRRRKLHIPRFRLKPKARSFRCSSSPNRTRCAGLRFGTAAPPPFGRKALRLGKIKSWSRTGAPLRAGTEDAYSGKIRPSQAQDSPRRRCPR